jgi:plastocyanin
MMRRRAVVSTIVLVAGACGGGSKAAPGGAESTAAPAGAPGAPAVEMPATGKTWDVRMTGDATGYRFEPRELSIRKGDAVKWTLVSGGPHDVTFWRDSIPRLAEPQLQANMKGAIGPLTAPMTLNPGDSFSTSFAGVPVGVYHYYCTPHLAMNMIAKITVN